VIDLYVHPDNEVPVRFICVATLATVGLNCSAAFALDLASDYRNLTCTQLEQEGRAISVRGFVLSGLDPGLGGVAGTKTAPATIIIWPPSPTIDGKRSESLALALKQMEAVEQASVQSQCSIRFQSPNEQQDIKQK
jgi:hypothetical protein